MKQSYKAFTMIELVFVIIILGILAAIAVPRFAATRTDADITKGRADIASIRSSIVSERQTQLIRGVNTWIPKLSEDTTTLFTGDGSRTLLMYGIASGTGSGHWQGNADGLNYTFAVQDISVAFVYTPADGIFTCESDDAVSGQMCKNLTN